MASFGDPTDEDEYEAEGALAPSHFYPANVAPPAGPPAEVNLPRLTNLAGRALEDILIRGEFDERLKAASLVFDIANMRTTRGRQAAGSQTANVQLNNFNLNASAQEAVLATLKKAFGQAGLSDRIAESKAVEPREEIEQPDQRDRGEDGHLGDPTQPAAEGRIPSTVSSVAGGSLLEVFEEKPKRGQPAASFDFSLFEAST